LAIIQHRNGVISRIVRQLAFMSIAFLGALVLLPESGCDGGRSFIEVGGGPSVTVTPATVNLTIGQLGAAAALVSNAPVGMDRSVTWMVRDTSVAQITYTSPNGATVIGRKVGTTVLIASAVVDSTTKAAAVVVVQ
jgi:hypothetical protein